MLRNKANSNAPKKLEKPVKHLQHLLDESVRDVLELKVTGPRVRIKCEMLVKTIWSLGVAQFFLFVQGPSVAACVTMRWSPVSQSIVGISLQWAMQCAKADDNGTRRRFCALK